MVANISYSGTDIDSIYETPRLGTARADVNYQVAGLDIANRFTSLGSATVTNGNIATRIPPTGILTSAGIDFSSMFVGNPSQYSITTLASPSGSTTKTVGSTATLTHQFTVTFTSATALAAYFKFGGRIQISAANGAGASAADIALTSMFSSMGTFVMYENGTYRTGTGGTVAIPSVGATNFGSPSGTVTFFTLTDGSPYGTSGYTITIAANNTVGSVTAFTFTCTVTLAQAGSVADSYAASRTSFIRQRNYSGVIPSTQPSPTYTQTIFNW